MRLSSDCWWLMGAAAAAVALAPLIVHGDPAVTTMRDHARQLVAQMSPAERQRLNENYERYREMSNDERAAFRALHDELATGGAAERRGFEVYSEWRRNLASSYQREKLREEVEPGARVALIAEIEDERESQAARRPGWWRFSRRIRNDEFYRVMEILGRRAASSLSSEDQTAIFAFPADSPGRVLTLIKRLRAQGLVFKQLVPEAALDEMAQAISDRDVIEKPEWRPNGRDQNPPENEGRLPYEQRLQFMRNQLFHKLSALLWQETMQNPPSDAKLLARLDATPAEERDSYDALAADQLKQRLRFDVLVGDDSRILQDFFEPEPFWFGGPSRGDSDGGRNRGRDGGFDGRGRRDDERRGRPGPAPRRD